MADFAGILRKNIEKLGDTTPDVREKIYAKAREALERKIAAIEPPPSQAAVDRQFSKLAEAVSEVEAEFALPPAVDDQLDDLDKLLNGDAEADTPVATELDEAVASPETAVADGDELVATDPVSTDIEAAPEAATQPEPVVEPQTTEPSQEEDPLRVFLEENVETLSMPETASLEMPDSGDVQPKMDDEGAPPIAPAPYVADAPIAETKQSGPAWGRLGVFALLLAILGGGGYYASTLPQVQSALGLNASGTIDDGSDLPVREVSTTTVEADETEPEVAPDNGTLQDGEVNITLEGNDTDTIVIGTNPEAENKFTQRLTEDGVEVDEGPAPGTPSVGEGTSVADQTIGSDPVPDAAPGEETALVAEDEPAAEETPSETGTPLLVGQRAIFYEERTGTEAGTAGPGSVIWTQVQESPGGDLPLEPAIRGEVSIQDLDVSLVFTIRRNGDRTLPASHFIELSFDVPDTFTGRGIADVQRVTFKGSEEDPGTALIGVFVPIDTNFFLVGLNDSAEATANNIALMRSENWIDVPIQYVSGRRALVTIEKGTPGERIFEEVFEYWAANPLPVEG